MPIVNTDIKIRYSGGSGNTDPNASLGGVKSTTEPTDNSLNNMFADSGGTESLAGSTKYRCVYIHNSHGSLTMKNVRVYISSLSSSTDDEWDIGLGSAALNATEQTVANEDTAPTSVTFTRPTTYAAGLASADIPTAQHRSVWYKRIVTAGAGAATPDSITLKVDCDTDA